MPKSEKLKNDKLIAARQRRGWSQTVAAEKIGLSRVHLARLEAGSADPHGSTVGLICQAYQMSSAALGYPDVDLLTDSPFLGGNGAQEKPVAPFRGDEHEARPAVEPPSPPFDEGQLPLPEYFVGRLEDLAWVMRQMHEGQTTAITALNGLGGIGKTALASVVVHRLREERAFPDGIAVIFCIGVVDAVDILRRILARFDPQRRQPETSEPAALYEVAHRLLKGKRALVVLDNVEPGLDIGMIVGPLKSAGATLLLTSRQALSRAVVPVEASRLLELLPSGDALELFVRSLGYSGMSELSVRDRQAAERIIMVLDRHTLAVRLAAAYAADLRLDLEVFARDLEQDPLDVPAGEVPRAVMLVFSQSTVALSSDALRLFAALAAFATPVFGRNAALALAKGLDLAQPRQCVDLLVLRALVSASVDENMPVESDRERLRLHPLLRAFAAEHFVPWSEDERAVAYHAVAVYYVTYFNRTTDKGLSVDEANIVGALEWAHHHKQDEIVVTLCSGMRSFWLYRLRMSASQVFLPWGVAAALAIAEQTGKREDRLQAADLSLTYGQMLRYTGRVDAAEEVLERNLVIRREVADRRGEEEVLSALGQLYRRSGRTALAEQYFLEALTILQDVSNKRSEGLVRLRMARIARRQGRQEEAERYIYEALALDRETQNVREESLAVVVLGQYAHDQGQLEEAREHYRQALLLARDVKDPLSETIALNWLGRLAHDCGQLMEAERFYQQSLVIVQEVRNRLGESVLMVLWGQLAQARGDIDLAKSYYGEGLVIAREVHDRRGEGTALLCIGQLVQAGGEVEQARAYYEQSLAIAREVLDRRIEGIGLSLLGRVAQAQGRMEKAKRYYEQSLAIAREVLDQSYEGRVLGLLGTLAEAAGDLEGAKQRYEQSLTLAQHSRDRRGEGLALSALCWLAAQAGGSTEQPLRQALDLLREQDTMKYAEVALRFGTVFLSQEEKREDGCLLVAEAARLYKQMRLAGRKDADRLVRQFGCGEPGDSSNEGAGESECRER